MTAKTSKVALVTGGANGIGKAIVQQLSTDGYKVAFCYASDDKAAQEIVDQQKTNLKEVYAEKVDVSDYTATKNFVDKIEKDFGPIEVVINNAGITMDKAFMLMDVDAWTKVVSVNLNGVFNVSRSAIFNMLKRKSGSIVNMSSISGIVGNISQANYSATKAGIIGFSLTLSKELGPFGIRVNVVAPGLIKTRMTENLDEKQIVKNISLRRLGCPQDIADIVSFLVSEKAAYITGQIFRVDGGLSL